PNGIVVWGGPNFPLDLPSQKFFLKENSIIDFYVPLEGEVGFSNIIEKALEIENRSELKTKIQNLSIPGCINTNLFELQQIPIPGNRIKQLDEIPSPYSTGLLDEFFDGRLAPMLQTNRGCPFSCTFCADGSDLVRKINSFSNNRVKNDLEYIAKHVPSEMHSMHISDLNFGMYTKDIEVCKIIKNIQNEYKYPKYVKVTSGKNKKDQIIEAIKILGSSTFMAMSVQSMNQDVLSNIKRDNISSDHLVALGPTLKNEGLHTMSDVILGLPGETYETHLQTIKDLVDADIDWIDVWTLMLIDGSELNTPQEKEKWGLKTKFRVIPRDFTKLTDGKVVVEIEEVGIGSNTLSFDEYLELRLFALILRVTKSGTIFEPILKFLRENNFSVFNFLYEIFQNTHLASTNLQKLFTQFRDNTIGELWDSPEEIEKNYQDDVQYQKLLDEKEGQNLIYYYHALVISNHMSDWIEFVIDAATKMLSQETKNNIQILEQFNSVSTYCRGIGHNVLGDDRMKTEPEFLFKYDIIEWLASGTSSSLSNFKNFKNLKLKFKLSDEQYSLVEDNFSVFGKSVSGKSQVIKVVPESKLWRYAEKS
ncbi:radical SAM protein, partial [Candidatus Nitrosopelagicus sp.]|nr:radical SAM protein [Candidatus Nitrosopelagicus sp.]